MHEFESHPSFSPEDYREYLQLFARLWLPKQYRRKMDASDLVQDALFKAHAKKAIFAGNTTRQYKAWLRKILRNHLLDKIKELRLPEHSVQAVENASHCANMELASEEPSVSSKVTKEKLLDQMAKTLADLPDEWQDVIVLHYFCGFNVGQIAEDLGRSKASVAGFIRRGLDRLRKNSQLKELFGAH
jgi:RNA polymerase sigma-70 factor (ECF subfamily)